jgi:hypothetical protein
VQQELTLETDEVDERDEREVKDGTSESASESSSDSSSSESSTVVMLKREVRASTVGALYFSATIWRIWFGLMGLGDLI